MLAASEVATNAIRHGRGSGVLRLWSHRHEVVCQVESRGHISDPLAGRRMPAPHIEGGIGLWLVNQLCDLVEARSIADVTTVRLHASLD